MYITDSVLHPIVVFGWQAPLTRQLALRRNAPISCTEARAFHNAIGL